MNKDTRTPIIVEPPYSDTHDRGYVFYSNDGLDNTIIFLYRKGETRFDIKTPYARYLMETKLGRFLNKNERVYHKDKNRLNHSSDNLEVKILNSEKPTPPKIIRKKAEIVELICSNCHTKFPKAKNLLSSHAKNRFCSVNCQHAFARTNPKTSLFNMQSRL